MRSMETVTAVVASPRIAERPATHRASPGAIWMATIRRLTSFGVSSNLDFGVFDASTVVYLNDAL